MGKASYFLILIVAASFLTLVQSLQLQTLPQNLAGKAETSPEVMLERGATVGGMPIKRGDIKDDDFMMGLRQNVYFLDCASFASSVPPSLDDQVPEATRITINVNFTTMSDLYQTLDVNHFDCRAVRFTGRVLIQTPGEYIFIVKALGQAKLKIQNKVVIQKTNATELSEAGAFTVNKAGGVWIDLDYWNQGPLGNVILKYFGPDTGNHKVIIPPSLFSTPIHEKTSTASPSTAAPLTAPASSQIPASEPPPSASVQTVAPSLVITDAPVLAAATPPTLTTPLTSAAPVATPAPVTVALAPDAASVASVPVYVPVSSQPLQPPLNLQQS